MIAPVPDPDRRRRSSQRGVLSPLTIGLLALAAIAVTVAVVVLNADNAAEPLAVVATPTPAPTAVPATPDPTPVASEDKTKCAGKKFGANLAPLNAPSDLHSYSSEPAMTIDTSKLYRAILVTAKGNIFICLDPSLAPHTVNNFVTLARNNYYDGLTFYLAISGVSVSAGDPKGDGTGGPGYTFANEPVKGQYTAGAVAMQSTGNNDNGSAFFIATGDDSQSLAPKYNLFGYVESGLSFAQQVAKGDKITTVRVEED